MKKSINDIKLKGRKILIRVDFNVPIENGIITSEKRIDAALKTINKVIFEGGKAILFSHLGRIKNEEDKIKNSLEIVAIKLSQKINKNVKFLNETKGAKLEEAINKMKEGDILMLQNTRYEDLNNKAESKNNPALGKYWASLGDVFVNDAFGTAHRKHASNVGIASNISESCLGYLVQNEVDMLSKGLDNPKHPFVAIVGGAKVSDKIIVIENLLKKADKILIGGGMAFTFLKAAGYKVGSSIVEKNYLDMAKKILDKGKDKILLPIDHAVSRGFTDNKRQLTKGLDIDDGFMGLDLGDESIKLYKKELKHVSTVVWNGPMGVAEFDNFKQGTEAMCVAIANEKGIFSIIGGGDSAAAAIKLGFKDKFTHISTGGGASLMYMEGKLLPGIVSIQNKQ